MKLNKSIAFSIVFIVMKKAQGKNYKTFIAPLFICLFIHFSVNRGDLKLNICIYILS